ncbi:MAG: TolC family protein [Bacteroidales bacterium]|nr:TolC family protein [Bacteroidales bacterium]
MNRLTKILFCASIIFNFQFSIFNSTQAQDTVRMTLDSCLRYAYGHNITVRTAALNRESADVTLTGAKLRFLPSINASASEGLSWSDQTTRSGNVGINGSLTLFNGLNDLLNYRYSKLGAEQSSLKVQQAENSVGIQIVQAYLTVLMNEEKLAYQQEVLETSHQQQLEGEVKYQVGRLLESDYLLLEANYTSAQAEIDNTKLTIDDNRSDLSQLLDLNDRVIEAIPSTDSLKASDCAVPSYDTLLAQARRALPDWQISEMEVEMARLNVGMARSSFLPSLSLNAGTSYNNGAIVSDNPVTTINGGLNTSLTLGLSVPILNRGTSLTQYKQSKINLQQAQLQNYQTQIDLENNIQTLHITLQQALNRFRSAEALANAYRASYDVYVLKFAEGAVTTVEMLQQQDRYLSALNDYLQSKYSYILAEKQLDIYTGKEIKL